MGFHRRERRTCLIFSVRYLHEIVRLVLPELSRRRRHIVDQTAGKQKPDQASERHRSSVGVRCVVHDLHPRRTERRVQDCVHVGSDGEHDGLHMPSVAASRTG